MIVGNGENTNFWYDYWHPIGPLFQKFSENMLYAFRMTKLEKVAECIQEGNWPWPTGRRNTAEIRQLKQNTPTSFLPKSDAADRVIWVGNNSGNFTLKDAMKMIYQDSPRVEWYGLVWGKGFVPRYSFILWLACPRKLTTKDRVNSWGIQVEQQCGLCKQEDECLDHLFFQCAAVKNVWRKMLRLCGECKELCILTSDLNWLAEKWKTNSFKHQLERLVLAVTVYNIWRCRNEILYRSSVWHQDGLFYRIVEEVRVVVGGWGRVERSGKSKGVGGTGRCCWHGILDRKFSVISLFVLFLVFLFP